MEIGSVSGRYAGTGSAYDSYCCTGTKYKQNNMSSSEYGERAQEKSARISHMKKLIKESQNNQAKNQPKSILESTKNYGEAIRTSRTKANDTASQIKKLKYNFKNISSQLRRSKTSVNAKQVASKARREVVQLKAKLQTGKYDKEELEAAIEHAKSMERAAKKKARHLEEEELIKVTDSSSMNNSVATLEEKLESDMEKAIDDKKEELSEELESANEEQILEMERAMQESIEEVQEMMQASMEDSMEEVTEDMMDLLSDAMEDMMEETLGNLAESMMSVTDYEMSEEEFKTFKLKHRASEDKTMLEADGKYLKALFDMYNRRLGGEGGISMAAGGGIDFSSGNMGIETPNIVDVSL